MSKRAFASSVSTSSTAPSRRHRATRPKDLLATAVECACRAFDPEFRRVDLDVLGNADAFVHAHIWPRYEWEPPSLVTRPVRLYEPER